ncbi:MAG: serine/threonine protein kinase [Myxococcales bacterium]|nr:serine/threonine protein kinase [Myxococcales bacterium]
MSGCRDDEFAQTATAPGAPAAGAETLASGPGSSQALTRTKLGRFELESVLGKGGMGVVHAAYDPELERRVAVKVLHGKNADASARLLREARAMAKLSHANVITVFEVGTADGEDFVAMELIEGGTLGEWLENTKPRPRDVIAAFVAAGRGLAAAHAEGLVHRDFKPSNVLRSRSGRIVVTDFGLARSEGADGRSSRPTLDLRQPAAAPALRDRSVRLLRGAVGGAERQAAVRRRHARGSPRGRPRRAGGSRRRSAAPYVAAGVAPRARDRSQAPLAVDERAPPRDRAHQLSPIDRGARGRRPRSRRHRHLRDLPLRHDPEFGLRAARHRSRQRDADGRREAPRRTMASRARFRVRGQARGARCAARVPRWCVRTDRRRVS